MSNTVRPGVHCGFIASTPITRRHIIADAASQGSSPRKGNGLRVVGDAGEDKGIPVAEADCRPPGAALFFARGLAPRHPHHPSTLAANRVRMRIPDSKAPAVFGAKEPASSAGSLIARCRSCQAFHCAALRPITPLAPPGSGTSSRRRRIGFPSSQRNIQENFREVFRPPPAFLRRRRPEKAAGPRGSVGRRQNPHCGGAICTRPYRCLN